MLRRSVPRWGVSSYDMSIGSKHQKHQTLAPAPFLYRFVGTPGKPTPRLAKYWWTLGCYPSGRENPFRLDEFREHYVAEHVPIEVEEWLESLVAEPHDRFVPPLLAFVREMEKVPEPRTRSWKKAECFQLGSVAAPLQQAMEVLSISVPPIAVRGVCLNAQLKDQVLDTAHDLCEVVQATALTPFRRWAREQLQGNSDTPEIEDPELRQAADLRGAGPLAPPLGLSIASASEASGAVVPESFRMAVDVAGATAPDERLIVRLLCQFAQGACEMKKFPESEALLQAASRFAHDEEVEGAVQCNLSGVRNHLGQHRDAERLAKEAVLRTQSPRAYANWAVSVALQDRHDDALEIVSKGLVEHPNSTVLVETQQSLFRAIGGKTATPLDMQGKRFQVEDRLRQGIASFSSRSFFHQWDRVEEKGKVVLAITHKQLREGSHTTRRYEPTGPVAYSTGNIPT